MVAQRRLFGVALAFMSVLVGCSTPDTRNTPPLPSAPAFEFLIDPQAEIVSPVEGLGEQALAPQFLPSDTRILVPGEDIALADLQFRFERSGRKVLIRAKLTNISESEFLQPFFFTLSEKSETKNIVRALVPLVTDEQLGGDGILNPGETTSWLQFELVHKNKPFSIFVDVSAVVEELGNACTGPVDIPDDALEAAIRETLGKATGDITCEDMESLASFIASGKDISNLEGLQFAVNLTTLYLATNSISDLTPLQNLTNLTHLYLNENTISDLTPLQNLTNLTILSLQGNSISDLTPLQNLTNLTVLVLSNNTISDLTPLKNLTSLAFLYLGYNTISDITALVDNSGIEAGDEVYLISNPLATCPGSQARAHMDTLIARGAYVMFDPCLQE